MDKVVLNNRFLPLVRQYGKDILESPGMEMSKTFMQHGDTSVFDHSLAVALLCLQIARFQCIATNDRALVRGALLHDYFLYDWHIPSDDHRWHGLFHPKRALRNASRDFSLDPIERNMIQSHMFPLCFPPPNCRESWILFAADKICALREILRP